MKKIFYRKILLAVKFAVGAHDCTLPLTDVMEALQVITHKHKKGHVIKAHKHKFVKRVTGRLGECLVIIKGRIKVDLYLPDGKYFKSIVAKTGEGVLLLRGGHGVRFLTNARVVEVKNGPFINDRIGV